MLRHSRRCQEASAWQYAPYAQGEDLSRVAAEMAQSPPTYVRRLVKTEVRAKNAIPQMRGDGTAGLS